MPQRIKKIPYGIQVSGKPYQNAKISVLIAAFYSFSCLCKFVRQARRADAPALSIINSGDGESEGSAFGFAIYQTANVGVLYTCFSGLPKKFFKNKIKPVQNT
ncbi:MAG: hypothetical protein H7335_15665 [Massilia sp.]|nr:hypothetical protein [Massilia sp.]